MLMKTAPVNQVLLQKSKWNGYECKVRLTYSVFCAIIKL
jgi:hypothetical protein